MNYKKRFEKTKVYILTVFSDQALCGLKNLAQHTSGSSSALTVNEPGAAEETSSFSFL
jgi:hypothetical protein